MEEVKPQTKEMVYWPTSKARLQTIWALLTEESIGEQPVSYS